MTGIEADAEKFFMVASIINLSQVFEFVANICSLSRHCFEQNYCFSRCMREDDVEIFTNLFDAFIFSCAEMGAWVENEVGDIELFAAAEFVFEGCN